MKSFRQMMCVFGCVLAAAAGMPAQVAETFDIASFKAPAGWTRQANAGGLLFSISDQKKGSYAMIVVYKSSETTGSARGDFDADWRQYVAALFPTKTSPQLEAPKQADGWIISTGGSVFDGELGTSAVILRTYTGASRRVSVATVFNSQDYVPAIEAFAASLSLVKGAGTVAPEGSEAAIAGTWGKNLGAHMTYGDPVVAGMAGYSKDQYTFNLDGTYRFVSKTFRMSYDKILLVIENGTYQINGTNLSIKPQKSVIQAWSKLNGGDAFGRMISSRNRPLESVTYRFTMHHFTGIDQWNLVLQSDQPTDRDGPFSNNNLFTNAWYYGPLSANNPVIELPK